MQFSVFTWRHQNSNEGIIDYSECYFYEALQQLNTFVYSYWKHVGKNVHARILKGNIGYDQHPVLGSVGRRTYFCYFLRKRVHGLLCHSFRFLWRTLNSKPPTMPFGVVACTYSDKLSRNSCIQMFGSKGLFILRYRDAWISKLLRDAVFRWRPGQLSNRLKMLAI